MTTPNSIDDELKEVLRQHYGDAPIDVTTKIKSLYLTHRNTELEKLLKKKVIVGGWGYVPVSAIRAMMEEK